MNSEMIRESSRHANSSSKEANDANLVFDSVSHVVSSSGGPSSPTGGTTLSTWTNSLLQQATSSSQLMCVCFCNSAAESMVELEDSLLPAATNNYVLCSMYLRHLKEAITKMETLIQDDPAVYMTDPIVFNLCTMYDLSYAPETSTNKKKALQQISVLYMVDDPLLHWRCFKLN